MRRRFTPFFASVVLVAAFAAWALAPGTVAQSSAPSVTTRVTVTATEFKFKLSKLTVRHGTLVFTLVNKGRLPHDFKIAGKKSTLVRPGKSTTLRVTITKAGKYRYVCTVAGHAAAGMKGVLKVT